MTFSGIPSQAVDFYQQLEADNSKAFWQSNRHRFRDDVRAPMEELCAELEVYGPFHLFRPHNDLRFSKNRPPYKTHQGAYSESEGGTGYYLHVSAQGLMCASGYYSMAADQLQRFRAAVDGEASGHAIAAIVSDLQRRRYTIGAIDELKTAPRGFPRDHPRIGLIRRKGLMASKDFGAPAWLHTRGAATRIRDTWRGAAAMGEWLDAHVGPSTLEPDGFFH